MPCWIKWVPFSDRCRFEQNAWEVTLNELGIPSEIRLERAWRLGDRLGEGGFSDVYLAQGENGEAAVVKLVRKAPGAERELLFEELDGAPNVVPILDRGEWGDWWVLVMSRAEKSLRDHLGEMGGQLPLNEAVAVLVDIVEALVGVEGRRVVHRDIKPENVLLLDGRWCLADFGIARYAEATTAPDTLKHAMTPPYAAPEQWRGDTATNATDVYALGVVAYELITGKRPFLGPDFRRQHLEESPEPVPGIPDRLRSLVSECLYKGPGARPFPQNLLVRLKASIRSASPAGARLQQANALAVERQTEAERQQSAAQAEAERRRELRVAADQSLENILDLLDRQIKGYAPAVRTSEGPHGKRWELNDARLSVDPTKPVTPGIDRELPFEVIAYAQISLASPPSQSGYTGRSHSLWYCDAHEPLGNFRWYETAFWALGSGSVIKPFAMPPEAENAALALSTAMHTYYVEYPVIAIDQGDEDSFVERWMGWFGDAAKGQLRDPSSMTESNPQDSWRRGR